tara:strand:+ start:82 stop:474 length:393 start_codon:yes stop_codon:yes gene_type:complete
VVYASGSVRTKVKAGSTARQASLAVEAARRTRIVLILLVVLLRLNAPLQPNERQALLVSLGRRKLRRRSNGKEETQNSFSLHQTRGETPCFQRSWLDSKRPGKVQPCYRVQVESPSTWRRKAPNFLLRKI